MLTEKMIERLPRKPGQRILWDEDVRGFGVRLGLRGPVYLVQGSQRNRTVRRVIGRAGPGCMALRDARRVALTWLHSISQGDDPKPRQNAPAGETFADAREQFLADYKLRRQPRTYAETTRQLHSRECEQWVDRAMTQITTADVRDAFQAKLKRLQGRAAKRREKREVRAGDLAWGSGADLNRWLSALSSLFRWCGQHWRGRVAGIEHHNPAFGWGDSLRLPERGRELTLRDEDLGTIWHACLVRGRLWARFYRLLMLLGCRRGELAGLRWSEVQGIDGDEPYLDLGTRTKAGHRIHRIIPLPPRAVALLRYVPHTGPFVFGGERELATLHGADVAIQRRAGLNYAWSVHMFRSALASWAASTGWSESMLQVALGHTRAFRAGALRAYVSKLPVADHRRMLEAWQGFVSQQSNSLKSDAG